MWNQQLKYADSYFDGYMKMILKKPESVPFFFFFSMNNFTLKVLCLKKKKKNRQKFQSHIWNYQYTMARRS